MAFCFFFCAFCFFNVTYRPIRPIVPINKSYIKTQFRGYGGQCICSHNMNETKKGNDRTENDVVPAHYRVCQSSARHVKLCPNEQ
jgi:hypothetical protein